MVWRDVRCLRCYCGVLSVDRSDWNFGHNIWVLRFFWGGGLWRPGREVARRDMTRIRAPVPYVISMIRHMEEERGGVDYYDTRGRGGEGGGHYEGGGGGGEEGGGSTQQKVGWPSKFANRNNSFSKC